METETISEERSPVFSTLSLLHRLVLTSQARKDSGFTRTQLIIVYALAARGELNMSQIADFIGASKEQATRAVAPLVDAGKQPRTGGHPSHGERQQIHAQLLPYIRGAYPFTSAHRTDA